MKNIRGFMYLVLVLIGPLVVVSGYGSDTPMSPSSSGPFTLTSSAFSANGVIPLMHAAPFATGGGNVSPPLSWSASPTGTMSYAVIMKDLTVPGTHWVIYDIPASVMSLGADMVPGGAKEGVELTGRNDYTGPFPPIGQTNTYEFRLYAVSVSTLPGVPAPGAGMPTVAQVEAALAGQTLDTATLRGVFTGV